jgi:hypothetical protein
MEEDDDDDDVVSSWQLLLKKGSSLVGGYNILSALVSVYGSNVFGIIAFVPAVRDLASGVNQIVVESLNYVQRFDVGNNIHLKV